VPSKTYEGEACSAARALEVVGERWSLLIVRDALFAGSSRFSQFQRQLGMAPTVLTARLRDLVAAEVFAVAEENGRPSYRLTEKGRALAPVVIALTAWGDRWVPVREGRPISYRHADCGGEVKQVIECCECHAHLAPSDIVADVASWAHEVKRSAVAARTS